VRSDPTDNGGLFVGRRPGTAPVRYRGLPARGSAARRTVDRGLAAGLLALMFLLCLAYWGPIPAGGLWIAGRVQYWTDNLGWALLAGFVVLMIALFGGLMLLKRMDQAWILVRRAAGHDQRQGVLRIVFPATAAVGFVAFMFWLLIIAGPGASLAPGA
jgi:hypothetical protein